MDYSQPASPEMIKNTVTALEQNGIEVIVVPDGATAKAKVLELIPEQSEVFQSTSVTLDELGISEVLNDTSKFNSVRAKLMTMDRDTQGDEMRRLGAAPQFMVGSVHAVTEDGKVVIASNTGSQLAGYAYGAEKLIWVVGAQKLVKNLDAAMDRVSTHTLSLENVRVQKAYGMTASFISKLLIFNREPKPGRITMVIVETAVGY